MERVFPWPAVALAKAAQRVALRRCRLEFSVLRKRSKGGLRQSSLEDKTIHLGLRLTLAGYVGTCQSPRSK